MANNKLLINERQADLGQFMVGRLLPFRGKRQVGPFTFIDHMGPATFGNGTYMDVDQHPHIGLSTLTYLFKGEIEHRDSIGSIQLITPGDVGFMTAGHGVTHTERTPKFRRKAQTFQMHGYQIWVALPKEKEDIAPNFKFIPKNEIPKWNEGDLEIKLVAGQAFGKSAPLQGYSPLFMVDIYAEKETTLNLARQLKGEVAFVIVEGEITEKDHKVKTGQMLISKSDEQCSICLDKGTRLLLFGGEPLDREHYLLWNFVSSDKDKLKAAKQRWQDKAFPKVPGDDTYIDFPKLRR